MVNFDAAPNKTAKIKLDTNAKLEPRSTLNVAFSTADQDTAMFKFTVTQDNKILHLGGSNVDSNIYLKHANGSHISEKLTITDSLNGELGFQIPNDFVKIPGNVTAQVYVARKGKKQAIVAERIFSFTIQKSLAWEFDSETKLAYIIEFNELRERILNRQKEIEDAMSNSEDYVSRLEQAKEKGLSDIEIAKANSLEELNDLADTRLQEINNKGTEYLDSLDNVQDEMDEKIAQFNSDVDAGEYVKESNTESWQKNKITSDNGHVQSIDTIDFNKIDDTLNRSGFYYVKNVINGPEGDYQTEGNIVLYKFDNNKDRLNYQPRSSNKIFTKYKYGENSIWSEWYDLTHNMETKEGSQTKADKALEDAKTYIDENIYDTGWQTLTVMGNVSKHDSAGSSMYRVVNGVCEIRFNIGIDRWTNQLPIIQPPANAKPTSSFSFLARTNGSPGKNPAVISYDTSKGYFKVWTNGDNTMNSGDYIYGHVVYIVGGSLDV